MAHASPRPAAALPASFRQAWSRARGSAFAAWWREAIARALENPATERALPRERTRSVLGREDEAIERELLPRLRASRRERLLRALARAEPVDALVAGCVLDLLASHRPFLVADELLKDRTARIEGNFLEEALRGLSPAGFFAAHLAPPAFAELRAAWPAGFEPAAEPSGPEALQRLALGLDESAVPRGARAVVRAWRGLLDAPRAFDYGCGLGALTAVLGEEFDASGGDIYEHAPVGELSRAVAWLRTTRELGAPPPDETEGLVRLDLAPGEDSPPADGRFSVVTCNGVLEHVIEPAAFEAVTAKLVRLLRPGGVLVLNASPTRLGIDGHHALHPAWGILLHRVPALQARFGERWRAGYTHRVGRRRLREALGAGLRGPRVIWPQAATVRRRFGPLAPAALPLLRALGGTELAPTHAWVLHRRVDERG